MSSQSPLAKELPAILDGEFYVAQLDVSQARNDFDPNKEPTLKIKCNTLIVTECPIDDFKIAFNLKMFEAPFQFDVHKDDNVVIIKGNIAGVWVKHNSTSTKKVKIVYGNNIVYTHAHRNVFLDIETQPTWIRGAEQTAPAPNTVLVTKAVSAGHEGFIYGFEITATEANEFLIKWNDGAARQNRIVFASAGTMLVVFSKAYNEGEPAADTTNITIENVNAGNAGKTYSARLLYGERET